MNPYFALSVVFLLGLRGIEKKLPLPGPPVSAYGDGPGKKNKNEIKKLATSLEQATTLMMREGSVAGRYWEMSSWIILWKQGSMKSDCGMRRSPIGNVSS